jgi:hypothetical protein
VTPVSSSSSSSGASIRSRLMSSFSSSTATQTPGQRRPVARRKVRVGDRELVRRVIKADAVRALEQALDRPLAAWASAKHTREFTILSGSSSSSRSSRKSNGDADDDDAAHEVLVVGEVACSPQELASVLCVTDESSLNSSMRALHGGKFIYGSVVHVVGPQQLQQHLQQQSQQHSLPLSEGDHLAVKTSCFARSRMLGKNEEWCFLELFQRHRRDAGASSDFTVVQLSMRECELAAGKAEPNRRVEQLQGVSAVIRVEQIAAKPAKRGRTASPAVRVTFHALYSKDNMVDGDDLAATHTIHEDEPTQHDTDDDLDGTATASGRTAKARLQAFTESVRNLPAAVRRRRLGAQVLADTAAMGEAKNARCISCTRSLHLLALTVKRRCQLCSYNVCAGCCSSEKVETYNGHAATMTICRRCLECVDRCDYSHIQLGRAESEYILEDDEVVMEQQQVQEQEQENQAKSVDIDEHELAGPTIIMGGGDAKLSTPLRPRPAGSAIVDTLRHELESDETKAAAMTVIKHLLETSAELQEERHEEEEFVAEIDEEKRPSPQPINNEKNPADLTTLTPERVPSASPGGSSNSSEYSTESEGWQRLRSTSSPEECVSAVEAYFLRREHEVALGTCELANASRRNYPLDIDADGEKPVTPIPSNEVDRLRVIDQLQLMELSAPMQELDIICEFLNLEIGLFCTMITIVGEAYQLVLACNVKDLVMASLPREHTFCQHLLMDDKPFVINNPEADVRFYNMNPITQNGVQFYCGIPIQSDDGLVVGSICCLNLQPVHLTRSQFGTLTKFGRIASRIIMAHAKQQLGQHQHQQLSAAPVTVDVLDIQQEVEEAEQPGKTAPSASVANLIAKPAAASA